MAKIHIEMRCSTCKHFCWIKEGRYKFHACGLSEAPRKGKYKACKHYHLDWSIYDKIAKQQKMNVENFINAK